MREELLNKGYKEGNNCYWKNINENTIYFNMDDDGNFTTITMEVGTHGGNEIILYDSVEDIQEVENSL